MDRYEFDVIDLNIGDVLVKGSFIMIIASNGVPYIRTLKNESEVYLSNDKKARLVVFAEEYQFRTCYLANEVKLIKISDNANTTP